MATNKRFISSMAHRAGGGQYRSALTRTRARVSYLSRHSFREPGGTSIGLSGRFSVAGARKESCVEQEADGSRALETQS
jgi:hypothetical protein